MYVKPLRKFADQDAEEKQTSKKYQKPNEYYHREERKRAKINF